MTIHFNYKTVRRPDRTEVKTPSIPITISGEEKIETLALLDSGADISAISKEMAEILGLDISGERKPAFGIGGKVDSIDTSMGIIVQKGHEKYSLTIPVKVIMSDFSFPVLLGRAGFFDKFIVSFHQANEKVSLKKLNMRSY